MIGVEWTRTSFRAFRLNAEGAIRDRRASPRGTARVQDRRFGDALREEVGPWLAAGEQHVLLAGAVAVGPEGWAEAATVTCPAGAAEIAAALAPIGFDWAEVRLLPHFADGTAETSRGEEAGFAAALAVLGEGGVACLPGARSRWVRVAHHRIAGFTTHLTGEVFAALRPPMPGREPAVADPAAFDAGFARAGQQGGLLHHLAAGHAPAEQGSYLFGLLVGHETRAALAAHPDAGPIHVIGPSDLTAPYARAIEAAGGMAEQLDGEAAARGFALIGRAAGLLADP